MINQYLYFYLLICFLTPFTSNSQNTLDFLSNPSFEDTPRKGGYHTDNLANKRNEIKGWNDCGIVDFPGESAPDIHEYNSEFWKVNYAPSHGNTFLGLVVRDNNSWEQVSQLMKHTLEKDKCYNFTIDLAKSNHYVSGSRLHKEGRPKYNYTTPVNLRVWGGLDECEKFELLYISPPVENEEWQTYEVTIQPTSDIIYITLQAYYVDDGVPYNGNILVDNISEFVVSDCKE